MTLVIRPPMVPPPWPDPAREALCGWLRAHDIDPGGVPDNALFVFHGDGTCSVQVVALDDEGLSVVGGDDRPVTVERRFRPHLPWPLAPNGTVLATPAEAP